MAFRCKVNDGINLMLLAKMIDKRFIPDITLLKDIAVVFFKVTDDMKSASVAGALALGVLVAVWLGFPIWRRNSAASR